MPDRYVSLRRYPMPVTTPDRYVAVIFDVGEREVHADSIEQAAQHFALTWGSSAVLEVRRADYRDLSR